MELAESSLHDYRVSELAENKHHLPDAGAGVGGREDCMSIVFPGQAMSRVLILVSALGFSPCAPWHVLLG